MKATLILLATFLTLNANASFTFGGEPDLVKKVHSWVNKNVKYPKTAIDSKTEGTVYISFDVVEGEMKNVQVVQGVSEELDSAAVTTCKNVPVSQLGNSQAEDNTYILPVKFEIR
jgi:TonB family protein